jgi:hypothetical protein
LHICSAPPSENTEMGGHTGRKHRDGRPGQGQENGKDGKDGKESKGAGPHRAKTQRWEECLRIFSARAGAGRDVRARKHRDGRPGQGQEETSAHENTEMGGHTGRKHRDGRPGQGQENGKDGKDGKESKGAGPHRAKTQRWEECLRIFSARCAHIFGSTERKHRDGRPGQGQEEWSEMLITMAGTDPRAFREWSEMLITMAGTDPRAFREWPADGKDGKDGKDG